MDGYRGGLPYTYYSQMGRQATPGYNPFSKKPDWASAIRETLKNMQMMRQMKEQGEERLWEREEAGERAKRERLELDLRLRDVAGKKRREELKAKEELRLEKEAKEELTPEQYKRWKYKLSAGKPSIAELKYLEGKKYISPRRDAFIKNMVSDINTRVKGYQGNRFYGTKRVPGLEKKVSNLQSALAFLRGIQAIGTERKLESEEWASVLKASDLDKVEQAGRFWEKKPAAPIRKGVAPWGDATDVELNGRTLQLSPSKKLLWDGTKIIPQNPDGTFTIGGKKYKLG